MKFRHQLEFGTATFFFLILTLIPKQMRFRVGSLIGICFYALGIRRTTAIHNLRAANIVNGEKSIRRIIRQSYKQSGRTFIELLFLDRTAWREGTDYRLSVPPEFFQSIKNGAILVSAHLGNWEMMGKTLVEKNVRLAGIVHRQENPLIDRWINAIRKNTGMTVVYDHDIFRIRRLLSEGYSLALLADQDLGQQSVIVRFFGRDCRAVAGPAVLAKRLQCPIWICYSLRRHTRPFDFIIEPFFSDPQDTIDQITQQYTFRFEQIIRDQPEQWFWAHRRWKIDKL